MNIQLSKILAISLIVLCASVAIGQPTNNYTSGIVVPPPNAAALGKFADIPVDYASGLPSVSVPIHTVTDGPLQLPIGLSYHTSGIRVNENASWVGTGWSLSAGGMISRTVMGSADEDILGYWSQGYTLAEDISTMCAMAGGTLDGQPDMFTVMIPGLSVKFLYDKDNNIHIIDRTSQVKIERFAVNGDIFGKFIVTTPDGTRYHFGVDPDTNATVYETLTPLSSTDYWTSSWMLTRIESHDLNYHIDFNYTNENYSYKTGVNAQHVNGVVQYSSNGQDFPNHPFNVMNVSGKRLTSITNSTNTETVTFEANTNRVDIDGISKRLDAVSIQTGSYCTRHEMTYGLFEDYTNTNASLNLSYFKRLRLDQVQEKSCNGNEEKPPHKFEYAGPSQSATVSYFPHRLSKAIDHWGYYNGKHSNDNLAVNVPNTTVIDNLGNSHSYGSADRDSDGAFMSYGSLDKITYPTAGFTEFTMETNTAQLVVSGTPTNSLTLVACNSTPGPACCGNWSSQQNYLYTTQDINATFDMDIVGNFYPPFSPQGCSSSYTYVEIEIFQTTAPYSLLGAYSFNVSSGVSQGVQDIPLSDISTSLVPGTTYNFKLSTINGRGTFKIYQPSGSVNNVEVGGLRVSQIETNDDEGTTSNNIIKTYDYHNAPGNMSSGILFAMPVYGSARTTLSTTGTPELRVIFGDAAPTPLSGFDGRHIIYSDVVENLNGNGRTEYEYFTEQPPTSNLFQAQFSVVNQISGGIQYTGTTPGPGMPSMPEIYKSKNGQLRKLEIYSESGSLEHSKIITGSPNYSTVPGLHMSANVYYCFNGQSSGQGNGFFLAGLYTKQSPRTGAFLIDQVIETTDGITTITDYDYDPVFAHYKPKTITTTHSDNSKTRVNTEYPIDYNPATNTALAAMLDRNMIAPIKTMNQIQDGGTWKDISGTNIYFAKFNKSNGLQNNGATSNFDVYPSLMENYNRTWDNGVLQAGYWETQGVFNSYHPASSVGKGMPKQFTRLNWDPETYEWDNGVITKRTFKNFVWEYFYEPNTKMVNKIKDIDGQEVSYSYDALKRLKTTSARGGQQLSTYYYQYRGTGIPKNYVRSVQSFGSGSFSQLSTLESYQYLDGLGRNMQSVKRKYSSTSKDVITGITYDNQGRPTHQYTPYQSPYNDGRYVTIPSSQKYSLTEYYDSPLNRPEKVTPPDWYATTYAYGSNTSSIAVPGGGPSYSAGVLSQTLVTDPNGNRTYSYTDSRGRSILTRRTNSAGGQPSDTYNVYDEKNRLTNVIPPGANLNTAGLIYSYSYDGEDKVIRKKVPDAAEMIMKYDNRDFLTLSQDGNLAATSQWNATNYDDYGRPTQTGLITSSNPSPDNFTISNPLTQTSYDGKYVSGSTYSNAAIYKGKVYETRVKALDQGASWNHTYTYHRYDAYGRLQRTYGNHHLNYANSTEYNYFAYDQGDNATYLYRRHRDPAGAYHYTREINNMDHSGRLGFQRHRYGNSGTYTYISRPYYNHRDEIHRKLIGASYINGAYKYLQDLNYTYNEQGWLETMNSSNLGGGVSTIDPCATDQMLNPSSSSSYVSNDLFYLDLKYDNLQTGLSGTIQKNGNISQAVWRVRGRERQSYSYSYDYLDRLTTANYKNINESGSPTGPDSYHMDASYDGRGNIITLDRNGPEAHPFFGCYGAKIDDLSYTYFSGSNKLRKVNDSAPSLTRDKGFKPGNTSDYQYDANGNATYDPNKNVNISYNHLNLPHRFDFGSGKIIDIIYNAAGMKLRKIVKQNNVVLYQQDYINGIEYKDNSIESFPISEGRLYNENVNSGGALDLRYEYAIRDHLGNTRVMFTDKDNDGQIEFGTNGANNEILSESHYYPFGMEMDGPWMDNYGTDNDNKYLYNGKELNTDFGLDILDYGARWYDPSVARFHTMDRFAEKYTDLTPYHYGANSPNNYVDINGDSIQIHHKGVTVTYEGGQLYQNGKLYTSGALYNKKGKLNSFVQKTLDDLNSIANGGSFGSELIDGLVANSEVLTIEKGTNSYNSRSNTVFFDPNDTSGGLDVNRSTTRPSFIGLAHELAHGRDDFEPGQAGGTFFTPPFSLPIANAEVYASYWENAIRNENGEALREYYTTTAHAPARLVSGGKNTQNVQWRTRRFYPLKGTSLKPLTTSVPKISVSTTTTNRP